jgi:hypothetical protein
MVDFKDANDNIFGKLAGFFQNHFFRYRSFLDFKSVSTVLRPADESENTEMGHSMQYGRSNNVLKLRIQLDIDPMRIGPWSNKE